MSSSTSTLELFKYDTSTDGKEVFSINTALNANWDKIDSFASAIKSLSNLDAQGEKRFTDIQNSLANKLEADVLLEENGYIKFNNNLVIFYVLKQLNSSATIAAGATKSYTVTMPIAMTPRTILAKDSHSFLIDTCTNFTTTSFEVVLRNCSWSNSVTVPANIRCIGIGYVPQGN